MAIAAMAAAVGAAAIWRERTGEGQDLTVDLRESIYNVNPLIGLVLRLNQQAGNIPDYDPLPANFNFYPTVNGLWPQAPIGLGNPMTFVPFADKGRPILQHHRRLSAPQRARPSGTQRAARPRQHRARLHAR